MNYANTLSYAKMVIPVEKKHIVLFVPYKDVLRNELSCPTACLIVVED